jgi:hypothetical protein
VCACVCGVGVGAGAGAGACAGPAISFDNIRDAFVSTQVLGLYVKGQSLQSHVCQLWHEHICPKVFLDMGHPHRGRPVGSQGFLNECRTSNHKHGFYRVSQAWLTSFEDGQSLSERVYEEHTFWQL